MTFDAIARTRGLEFNIEKEDRFPSLKGDPLRLKQILINLLSNAMKYTPEGKVTLAVSQLQEPGDRVNLQFRVTDTGIGIPEDKIAHVFERFTSGGAEREDASGSTGLGLYITKQLIERQGGTIKLESESGQGTEATVLLPFTAGVKQPEKATPEPVKQSLPEKLSVLIVEDSPVNRMLLTSLLSKEIPGLEVTEAENGAEAVEFVRRHDFDLVLMDVKMPVMNGYQATREIRALNDPSKGQIPILGVTASAMPEQKQECLDAGMNGVVTKPLSGEILYAKIAETLQVASQ